MRIFRIFLFLLVIFNFAFFGRIDSFEDISHVSSVKKELSVTHEHNETQTSDNNEDCTDPCHAGFEHFGHTFINIYNPYIEHMADSKAVIFVTSLENNIKAPVLDGPSQPPRHT